MVSRRSFPLPLSISELKRSVRERNATRHLFSELEKERLRDGTIRPVNLGAGITMTTFSRSDEDERRVAERARELALGTAELPFAGDEIERRVWRDLMMLERHGLLEITPQLFTSGDYWGADIRYDRGPLSSKATRVQALFQAFLEEYHALVTANFGALANKFPLIQHMPLTAFVRLSDEKYRDSFDLSYGRNESSTNNVRIVQRGQLNFDRESKTLVDQGESFEWLGRSWSNLDNVLEPRKPFLPCEVRARCPLRGLVYEEIEDGLGKLSPEEI
jgi:hypothetical protein